MQKPKLNQYILCCYEPLSLTKTNKKPLDYRTLKTHNPLDPEIHTDYENARGFSIICGDSYGVGFVITESDNYFFIDLDNCIDENGNLSELATLTLKTFRGAYTEISHSGLGIHVIGRYQGPTPSHKNRDDSRGLEIYTSGRFCALTETQAQGDAETLHTQALAQYITDTGMSTYTPEPLNVEWTDTPKEGTNPPEDNNTLIQFMLNFSSKNSVEIFGNNKSRFISFKDLWEGNTQVFHKFFPQNSERGYDLSAADAALARTLSYFTGGNCERVRELMNLSGLKRIKWESNSNYLPRTILFARGNSFFTHAVRPPQPSHTHNTKNEQGTQSPITPELNIRFLQAQNYPELSTRGRVLDTSTNLKLLLDVFGIRARWNNMKRDREIEIPKCELFAEDAENSALSIIRDLALNNEMPITYLDNHLNLLSQKESYHPIVEALKKNPWDGVPRLDKFIDTLKTSNQELSYTILRKWMVSAIAASHSVKGFASQGVLVLVGEQNLGKTRFIQSLDPFNCDAVKTGALLDPKDKDCIRTLSSYWICELGELDGTFRKADIARIKSYVTESFDRIRFSYARKDSILSRRTVYAATVNDIDYLVDSTGNRRWWTVHVLEINENHGLDMAQVWAEVYTIWESGERTWINNDELKVLNEHNKEHELLNPLEELMYTFFDFSEGWETKKLKDFSATEVLRVMGFLNPTKAQCTQMGRIITKMTGTPPARDTKRRFHYLLKI